jgi:hypothetical protein
MVVVVGSGRGTAVFAGHNPAWANLWYEGSDGQAMIIAIIATLILASLAFTVWFTLYAPRVWVEERYDKDVP